MEDGMGRPYLWIMDVKIIMQLLQLHAHDYCWSDFPEQGFLDIRSLNSSGEDSWHVGMARVGHVSSPDGVACGRITLGLWKQRTETDSGQSGEQNTEGASARSHFPSVHNSHHHNSAVSCRLNSILTSCLINIDGLLQFKWIVLPHCN